MIASFRNPNVYTSIEQGWSWKQQLRLRVLREYRGSSARACDRIMFVSEDSARWIGDALNVPAQRRRWCITAWTQPRGRPTGGGTIRPTVPLHPLGELDLPLQELREADRGLRRPRRAPRRDPGLIIIGDDQDSEYAAQMERARLPQARRSRTDPHPRRSALRRDQGVLRGADLFVFPSYLETFGHPLLEAMASEIPTVAADIPVFREVAGDAAFYADPHKADALASAMEDALFSPRAREALIKRGRDRVRAFSWDATARNLSALFDDVLIERAAA
jgi:hypothetical protein